MICAGIIGFGYMGHFHYNATKKFPGHIQSVAVYDIDKNKREEADGFGMRTYDNLRDFLKEDLDLVIIATPNQWHAQYAVEAMKAGRNVLTEKPVTMTVKELEEVISWEKKTGKIFTVHQQRRHDADYQVVRDVVRSGEIGKVTTIESRVFGERGVCFGWRGDPVCGGGMLYDWGVHLIDQMLQLFQGEKVKSVSARLLSILTPAVDDYFELDMEFEKKVCAKIIVTTFALEKMPRWYVLGDKGTLKIEDFSGTAGSGRKIRTGIRGFDSVLGKKNLGPSRTMAPLQPEYIEEITLPVPKDETMDYWIRLLETLEKGGRPEVDSSEMLRVMQIVEAGFLSSAEKKIIRTEV